jgi:hypothetical protein
MKKSQQLVEMMSKDIKWFDADLIRPMVRPIFSELPVSEEKAEELMTEFFNRVSVRYELQEMTDFLAFAVEEVYSDEEIEILVSTYTKHPWMLSKNHMLIQVVFPRAAKLGQTIGEEAMRAILSEEGLLE